MLALRRVGGAAWDEIQAWSGRDPREVYESELRKLCDEGLIEVGADRVKMTRHGILLADHVSERFF